MEKISGMFNFRWKLIGFIELFVVIYSLLCVLLIVIAMRNHINLKKTNDNSYHKVVCIVRIVNGDYYLSKDESKQRGNNLPTSQSVYDYLHHAMDKKMSRLSERD